MTNEEIDNMPAGREMDALVVEKIFDKKVCHCDAGSIMCAFGPGHCLTCDGWIPKLHSTSISAAWEVVEKFECLYLFRCVSGPFEGKYECKLVFEEGPDNDKRRFYAVAETAPLAICRAGLRTVAQK